MFTCGTRVNPFVKSKGASKLFYGHCKVLKAIRIQRRDVILFLSLATLALQKTDYSASDNPKTEVHVCPGPIQTGAKYVAEFEGKIVNI